MNKNNANKETNKKQKKTKDKDKVIDKYNIKEIIKRRGLDKTINKDNNNLF